MVRLSVTAVWHFCPTHKHVTVIKPRIEFNLPFFTQSAHSLLIQSVGIHVANFIGVFESLGKET